MGKPFNPLGYPAGCAPGFDPSHPLAESGVVRISAIAMGGNVISLLNGLPASPVSGPAYSADGNMGLTTTYSAANARSTYPSANVNDTTLTVAAIFTQFTTGAFGVILSNATGVNGFEFLANSSSILQINLRGSAGTTFTTTISANVPYFVAISATLGLSNLVLVNLLTGVTKVEASGFGATVAPTGSLFTVGNRGGGGLVLNGKIACVMQSTAYLNQQQLVAAAMDPWSFWYPQAESDSFGAAAAAGGFFSRYYYDMKAA